jgi:hypothetical protein
LPQALVARMRALNAVSGALPCVALRLSGYVIIALMNERKAVIFLDFSGFANAVRGLAGGRGLADLALRRVWGGDGAWRG